MNKTDLVVLGLVFERDRYGYEILQKVKERHFEHWASINPASIYNHLGKLRKAGALSSRKEKVGRQPERTVYSLTEAGRRMLSDMVLEALSSPPHGEHLELLGVGFVYCADPADVLDRIGDRIKGLEWAAQHVSEEIEKRRGHIPLNWQLLMEASVDHIQVELRVFRRLAEIIESGALARSCERVT